MSAGSDTFQGHYLPVAARREVLRIYRDRRSTGTWSPWATGPLAPMAAMRETVSHFQGWLAHAVAYGPVGHQTIEDLTAQYRASEFYLDRMRSKPLEFRNSGRVSSTTVLKEVTHT